MDASCEARCQSTAEQSSARDISHRVRDLSVAGCSQSARDVDVLLTGVTGFVGRFVLWDILNTQPSDTRIAVIIRPSGKRSALERFAEEIVGHTLFAPHAEALSRILVISAALEDIDKTTVFVKHAARLIHCAANVKHYDPYDALERDNVGNVRVALRLAEKLGCQTLCLLSTCYVHPRQAKERPAARIRGVTRGDFYNDYCYTKWLGEEAILEADTTVPRIHILRLSCVGAPLAWDLQAHPVKGAAAHLGILSLACRGYLKTMHAHAGSRISVIPVDVAATAIVRTAFQGSVVEDTEAETETLTVHIHQICPDPKQDAYHLSLPLVFRVLRDEIGVTAFQGQIVTRPHRPHGLPWYYHVGALFHGRTQKALTLHEKVQDFVSTFSDGDLRFQTSLSPSDFGPTPPSEYEMAKETCLYAVRMCHEHELTRRLPASVGDRFWSRLGNKEPVQICLSFHTPLPLSEWPAFQRVLWSVCMGQRKCTTVLDTKDASAWIPSSACRLEDYIAAPRVLDTTEAATVLTHGLLQVPPPRLWHIQPIQGSEGTGIQHLLLRMDHGLADGVGMLTLFQQMCERLAPTESPLPTPTPTSPSSHHRTLAFWTDLWLGLVYAVLVVSVLFFQQAPASLGERSHMATVATAVVPLERHPSHTYTTRLLWRLTQTLAARTQQKSFLFAVPAAMNWSRPAVDMIGNDFVPLLLPVHADMTEEAFAGRCRLLRTRSARFVSWCLMQVIERGGLDGLCNRALARISAVVSSIPSPLTLPPSVASVHAVTTTPSPVPISVTAVTFGEKTYLTVRSHIRALDAAVLVEGL